MSMRDRILRREPAIPDRYISEAAAILLDSRDPHSGVILAERAIDRLAEVLLERDTAAATLDASNQEIIASLRQAHGIPADAEIVPASRSQVQALMSKEVTR